MKPGPVVPTPEGVSNGAPAVERKGAHTPPPTGIHSEMMAQIAATDWCPAVSRSHGRCYGLRGHPGPHANAVGAWEKPAILDWAPNNVLPLPNESPSEHIRNGLQMLAELEAPLLASGDYTQDRRALVADTKRRLGWALRGLVPHGL